MKKIGLLCLCLASLSLVGCFHIPDEDWLPSKNKVNTGNIEEENEMDQALNSFMDGINMIGSDWNGLKDNEIDEISAEELENIESEGENIEVEDDVIKDKEIISDEIMDEKIEESVTSDE